VSKPHVVIVGGGLAGLSAAHRLLHPRAADSGEPPSVTLLEAENRVGGKIRTEYFDNFILDSGPDSFLTTKPWALELALELGLEEELIGTSAAGRRAFIRRGRRLCAFPAGMSGLVPTRPTAWFQAEVLSFPGRLRALLDLLLPARAPEQDESITSFTRRRFGKEASDWMLEPLLAGIHGGSGDQLSIHATFPALALAEREQGSVMRGLRMQRQDDAQKPSGHGAFVTLRRGLQRLIDALAESISSCEMKTATSVRSIERSAGQWRVTTAGGEVVSADAVIVTAPAAAASAMLRAASAQLAGVLAAIPFAASTVVHLAYDRSAPAATLSGSGYLNPRVAGRAVAACTWSSVKFENRAPGGALLLRAFLKGASADLSDEQAVRVALEEIRTSAGISTQPRWHRVYRYPHGMPQYTLGHVQRLESIDRELRGLPGLFLAGHSYRGIGIPDTIRSAEIAALAALREADRSQINAI
jgi:oxygen-dependent protoporphyrinogen oxidase